jgi:hypothetical protein
MARFAPKKWNLLLGFVCLGLCARFAVVSFGAASGKSGTYDEPLHVASAWVIFHYHDFRVIPEDPPLWKYWAAIPNGRDALAVDFKSPLWRNIPRDINVYWLWCAQTLYRTPGNDAAVLIDRSRMMMVVLGTALGLLIAWWAWKLGGAAAAVAATVLYTFDPGFLGHSPLVKNDVPFTLVMLGVLFTVWQLGRRITWLRVVALVLLCGAAPTVKFSGLIVGPVVAALLFIRALLPMPWGIFKRQIAGRGGKCAAAGGVCLVALLGTYLIIWGCYGFRFSPTADPKVLLNTPEVIQGLAVAQIGASHIDRFPTEQEVKAWRPGAFVKLIQFAETHHLFPQAWLHGLLYIYATTILRHGFLCGEHSMLGWWYYFPLAMLFKTPVATLVAMGLAFVLAMPVMRQPPSAASWWSILCIGLPAIQYSASSLSSHLNIGLRHMFPVYPLLFIAVGVTCAAAIQRWRRPAMALSVLLAIGLMAESLMADPNYIAFFNAPAEWYGPMRLLGDSNLDWGQDLPLLADWQRQHPQDKLYLCYFGSVDPASYGIRYTPLLGGYGAGPKPEEAHAPGVLAVSATHLQDIYTPPEYRNRFALLIEGRKPLAVLGKTIYLYELRAPSTAPATGPTTSISH